MAMLMPHGSFDGTLLVSIDSDTVTVATCPFNGHSPCSVSCAMCATVASVSGRRDKYVCALSHSDAVRTMMRDVG